MRLLIGIFAFFLVTQAAAFLIGWRRVASGRRARGLLVSLFLLGNLAWPLLIMSSVRPEPPPVGWVISLGMRFFALWQVGVFLWLLGFGLLFLGGQILLRWPVRLLRRLTRADPAAAPANPGRRVFLTTALRRTAWGLTLGSGAWGLARMELAPRLVRYDLAPPGLPPALEGLTVAHLSDLHIGLWTSPRSVPLVLGLLRDLRPDLVVITGDIIEHRPAYSRMLLRHLGLLKAVPLGVYGTIGNHDIYTGADQVALALEGGGIRMLRGTHVSFRAQGLPLALIGVDDPGRHFMGDGGGIDLEPAMKGVDGGLFKVLLTHRPTGFEQAREEGIPLTLCGHTHGGQIGLPGLPNMADLAYRHTHGLYAEGGCLLHVSAGIGTVGLPLRIGIPPEITLLRLGKRGFPPAGKGEFRLDSLGPSEV